MRKNHTYAFAYGLGAVIVLYGLMLAFTVASAGSGAGGFLVFVMSLGDALLSGHDAGVLGASARRRQPRFPFLSGADGW